MLDNFIAECLRLWTWILAVQPIRVLIATPAEGMEAERALVARRIGQLDHVEILTTEQGLSPEGEEPVDGPSDIGRSDIVLFLADTSGEPRRSTDVYSDFSHLIGDIADAQQLGKSGLAFSLVRPFPDDEKLLSDWGGDLHAFLLARSQMCAAGPGQRDPMSGGVLADRRRRLFRSVWKGNIKTVDALEAQVVRHVGHLAGRIAWQRRGRRVLAAVSAVVLGGWLIVRYQLAGIILVVAIAGGIYLYLLDRRWTRSGLD